MGAQISIENNNYHVNNPIIQGGSKINCYNSGTTMRLLSGIAGLFSQETILYGDNSLNKRPISDLLHKLKELDIQVNDTNGYPPIRIKGPPTNKDIGITIRGDISSQFISSLMILSSVRGDNNQTTIDISKPIVSRPYIDLTYNMLKNAGVHIINSLNQYQIYSTQNIKFGEIDIPIDASSSAFFITLGSFEGNKIKLPKPNRMLPQADGVILDLVLKIGVKVKESHDSITLTGSKLDGFTINIVDSPDLFPILCVLATQAQGQSKIYGAAHLKYKESNRIQSTVKLIRDLGGIIKPLADGAIVTGNKLEGNCTIDPLNDHRIAMAGSIAATVSKYPVNIINPSCVSVSYPRFFSDLLRCGIKVFD